MFRGHLGVEKSIFQNPYFGTKRNFEWKWKSTLQRWAFISKLGFWVARDDPKVDPSKSNWTMAILFFSAQNQKFGTQRAFWGPHVSPPPPFASPQLRGCLWGGGRGGGGYWESNSSSKLSSPVPLFYGVINFLHDFLQIGTSYIWP